MARSTASAPPTAVFQFRADPELLQKVKHLAARKNVSANRYKVGKPVEAGQEPRRAAFDRNPCEGVRLCALLPKLMAGLPRGRHGV